MQILAFFCILIARPTQLCKQEVKTCATSLNDDKFAHPVIFGVFEGQFCDMSAQKAKMGHFALADVDFLLEWYHESRGNIKF
jgi:hypothetical protein